MEEKVDRAQQRSEIVLALQGALEETPECPECRIPGTVFVDERNGVVVCRRCGLTLENRVVATDKEWRSFSDGGRAGMGDPNRVGGREDALLGDMQMATSMARDESGLDMAQRQMVTAAQRGLEQGFREVRRLAEHMNLPGIVTERAREFFKRVHDSKQLRGKTAAVVAVCIYIACKKCSVDRTFKEMEEQTGISKTELGRVYNKIRKLRLYKRERGTEQGGGAANLMGRFCDQLGLSGHVADAAARIVRAAAEQEIGVGRDPSTMAGAAIFMAAQLHPDDKRVTLEQIATVTRKAPSTLRQMFRLLHPERERLLPNPDLEPFYASKEEIRALPA